MPRKILLIEDDDNLRSQLAEYLSLKGGFQVEEAEDGLKGLEKLKKEPFDLVITDITMPYISGIGIITVLKRENPDIPVVAITGYGAEVESLAQEKEADAVLPKPIETEKMIKLLEELLSKGGKDGS
ncbi:response regulator receiver protein [Thermodesulfatator indicus DSM 15286]|uniref:Response regulator receiver protein n=1 Tax=Thermodesulfatator indicus (strain DSM 15286 / JCM 11887 / CIR29812) TaxID=667014 RepID=F8A8F8_THEID|nr:response regulator [Thermodesulfatator indicus]AEH43964.1 response regulator receiver protein [Thermodesulfatator indicus DSM 15286]